MNADAQKPVSDLKQIGIPQKQKEQLREIKEDLDPPWFKSEQDIYKFAVAIAIAKKMKVKEIKAKDIKNSWRTSDDYEGSSGEGDRLDDREGSFAQMISLFYPESNGQPYKHSQYLAVAGINYLHNRFFDDFMTPQGILEEFFPEEDQE